MSEPHLYLLAAILGLALTVEAVARLKLPHGDSGALWATVAGRFGTLLWPLLFASVAMETLFPQLFARGFHLFADRTGALGRSPRELYPWCLAAPAVVWALWTLWELLRPARSESFGRWLSGSAGLDGSRAWILWSVIPLALPTISATSRLGSGDTAYPAALWSSAVVFSVTLTAIGLGRARVSASDGEPAEAPAADEKPDWHSGLTGRGLELELLASTQPSAQPSAESSAQPLKGSELALAGELGRQMLRSGRRGVAPELIKALNPLTDPSLGSTGGAVLVAGVDDCGQREAVAAMAVLLHRRYLQTTLVVTAGGAFGLVERMRADLDDVSVAVPTASTPLPDAAVWVADAEVLSDSVLPRLRTQPGGLSSVGLVVWWDLHIYSGVYGANLWALSRRLRRLIRQAAGGEARCVAFIRSSDFTGSQWPDFVRRVLPYDFRGREIHLPSRFSKRLHLYRLASQEAHFARGHGADIPEQFRHPALVAARESARLGWPTHLEVSRDVPAATVAAVGELSVGETALSNALCPSPTEAGASIRCPAPGEILSLPECFGTSGRAGDGLDHHMALVLPVNPYARYLAGRLDARLRPRLDGSANGASRRLICAEGDERLLRRHLLSALGERPDTHEGLQRDFLREDSTIRRVLQRLAETDTLSREEVRYLDDRGRLVIDHRYASREAVDDRHYPLDTVGSHLLEVVDPSAGHEVGGGVRLRIDPERAAILAYPGRIFSSDGRRFQIADRDARVPRSGTFVECRPVDEHATTWRRRFAGVRDLHAASARRSVVGAHGYRLTLLTLRRLIYEETVVGFLRRRVQNLSDGRKALDALDYREPLFGEIISRGLLLQLPEPVDRASLISLCAALQPVLQVHLAVAEDVLEVVPVLGNEVEGEEIFGLALVELFPGGLGLLDVLHDADRLLPDLLARARRWIAACPCRSELGCERCLQSPDILASTGLERPTRAGALSLLGRMVGEPVGERS